MQSDQILSLASTKLSQISDSPALDPEVLLAHILGKTREQLFTEPQPKITKQAIKNFEKLLQKRIKGTPVAYLTGKKEFFGLEFELNSHTLVPRPETEGLVELALEKIRSYKLSGKKNWILEIGTGSGCIAVSVAVAIRHLPSLKITATDISGKALGMAKRNAEKHTVNIKFLQSDLFANLKKRKFDLILANLPYVRETDYQKNLFELRAEPKLALTDGTNNWELITKFIKQLPNHINPKAIILMEIDPGAEQAVINILKKSMTNARYVFHKDLASRVRYCEILT